MAEDREVLRQIWSGHVPICFQLSSEDIVNFQKPDPYYLMCSRVSYFPLVIDKAIKYFSRFVDPSKQQGTDIWIEYEGDPIKWHYPIGLSWDLHCDESSLPWSLLVHFDVNFNATTFGRLLIRRQSLRLDSCETVKSWASSGEIRKINELMLFNNFPEDKIVRCNNRALIQSMFMSTIKEADALKHRSLIVSAMQKKEHHQLWHGLQDDKFDQFWAVNRKLMEHTNNELFRCIPFRIYQVDQPFIQRLFKPVSETGEPNTLGDLVKYIFPDSCGEDKEDRLRIVTHGIEPPFQTPLQWMSEHLSYPDNFLHICALPKAS